MLRSSDLGKIRRVDNISTKLVNRCECCTNWCSENYTRFIGLNKFLSVTSIFIFKFEWVKISTRPPSIMPLYVCEFRKHWCREGGGFLWA
jgi:uncharacterized membrane protein